MNKRMLAVAVAASLVPALNQARAQQTNPGETTPLWHFEAGG
jgi:hypothetical protein